MALENNLNNDAKFFVLPFRPKKSAKLYARIWDGESFPLLPTQEIFKKCRKELK